MAEKKLTLKEEYFVARLLSVRTSAKTIARIMGIAPSYVRKIKKRSGIEPLNFPSNYVTKSKEETAAFLFEKGYPIDSIAVLLDITGERVIRILKKKGLLC